MNRDAVPLVSATGCEESAGWFSADVTALVLGVLLADALDMEIVDLQQQIWKHALHETRRMNFSTSAAWTWM